MNKEKITKSEDLIRRECGLKEELLPPIQLQHILRALEKKKEEWWYINSQGFIKSEYDNTFIWYDLSLTYDQQDESVKLKIADILLND